VLHVLARDTLAGTELMVASLLLRSDQEVVEHELATLEPPGPIAARWGSTRRIASLGGRGGLAGAIWRLGRVLRSHEYAVVNSYGLRASVATRVLVRLLQPKAAFVCGVRALHVTEVERLDSPKARIASVVERVLSPLVDVYDANSRGALRALAELGVDHDRLVYIPNGLDLSLWSPREYEPDDEGTPLIMCAARFVERKRHQDLLHALAALRGDGRRFRAVLAGAGPTMSEMRALARRLGLGSSVDFPGTVAPEQVRGLLEQAAIACLVSTWEGMPGTLMEAMATGVAVVATDVAGTNELVIDGESGLLVPAYDPPALARVLGTLLDDPEQRARLGRGGRRRMEERFSLEVMLRAKEELYRDVAARERRRGLTRRAPERSAVSGRP
jgi:glycosyltransferase involved in cell wall biosynthesis